MKIFRLNVALIVAVVVTIIPAGRAFACKFVSPPESQYDSEYEIAKTAGDTKAMQFLDELRKTMTRRQGYVVGKGALACDALKKVLSPAEVEVVDKLIIVVPKFSAYDFVVTTRINGETGITFPTGMYGMLREAMICLMFSQVDHPENFKAHRAYMASVVDVVRGNSTGVSKRALDSCLPYLARVWGMKVEELSRRLDQFPAREQVFNTQMNAIVGFLLFHEIAHSVLGHFDQKPMPGGQAAALGALREEDADRWAMEMGIKTGVTNAGLLQSLFLFWIYLEDAKLLETDGYPPARVRAKNAFATMLDELKKSGGPPKEVTDAITHSTNITEREAAYSASLERQHALRAPLQKKP